MEQAHIRGRLGRNVGSVCCRQCRRAQDTPSRRGADCLRFSSSPALEGRLSQIEPDIADRIVYRAYLVSFTR